MTITIDMLDDFGNLKQSAKPILKANLAALLNLKMDVVNGKSGSWNGRSFTAQDLGDIEIMISSTRGKLRILSGQKRPGGIRNVPLYFGGNCG